MVYKICNFLVNFYHSLRNFSPLTFSNGLGSVEFEGFIFTLFPLLDYTSIHSISMQNKIKLTEVESSRTSLASRTSLRTHFEVLGLKGQVLGLGLEASSPRKLACPRLEDSINFWIVKILWVFLEIFWKVFWKTFFLWRSPEKFLRRPFFLEIARKIFVMTFFFFFWRALALVSLVLGLEQSCPWPRECLSSERLSLASDFVCVLGLEPCVLDSTSAKWLTYCAYTGSPQQQQFYLLFPSHKQDILITLIMLAQYLWKYYPPSTQTTFERKSGNLTIELFLFGLFRMF